MAPLRRCLFVLIVARTNKPARARYPDASEIGRRSFLTKLTSSTVQREAPARRRDRTLPEEIRGVTNARQTSAWPVIALKKLYATFLQAKVFWNA
ncbi:hypothetical protein FA10DRAFT_97455 [Acaromyces ingoldii]|uniref:Uncharacterized protein n=1 Tax=Acaromyces ingoldii TaxID=215250 RepID=A0A316YP04_9BASI|nr:hypothetical protein FA10DRAFT_97455 [Acaromyces ingoldii]PWN89783.1 hypothetical protein FA10DRAFT_97455 [Acaromyces ingoldii]